MPAVSPCCNVLTVLHMYARNGGPRRARKSSDHVCLARSIASSQTVLRPRFLHRPTAVSTGTSQTWTQHKTVHPTVTWTRYNQECYTCMRQTCNTFTRYSNPDRRGPSSTQRTTIYSQQPSIRMISYIILHYKRRYLFSFNFPLFPVKTNSSFHTTLTTGVSTGVCKIPT